MQKLNSVLKTTTLVVGVFLLFIATLDAVPSPRNNIKLELENNLNSVEKCEQFICSQLGIHVNLPSNLFDNLQTSYNNVEQCAIIFSVFKDMAPSFYSDSLTDDESHRLEILEMLARLGQNMIRDDLENSKRGLGFGMDRGFSGQQAAKHLMGLHAATWAGGPGRRRRSESDDLTLKRNVGFGMDRGFSGSQMARYMMGAEAANRIGKRAGDATNSGEPEE